MLTMLMGKMACMGVFFAAHHAGMPQQILVNNLQETSFGGNRQLVLFDRNNPYQRALAAHESFTSAVMRPNYSLVILVDDLRDQQETVSMLENLERHDMERELRLIHARLILLQALEILVRETDSSFFSVQPRQDWVVQALKREYDKKPADIAPEA